jgi:formate hydrogenlyase subunit 6/NADH:ubiquinone oxidoreductase subunit I
MFRHTISELKEALVCLKAGQVTLHYPFEPSPVADTFRGRPVLNTRKCMSCGACANACPSRLITLTDREGIRTLRFELGRCTYCANCRDVCPQEAIEMSAQFETSTANPEDLVIQAEFYLLTCRECGAVVGTKREVDVVREKLSDSPVRTNYIDYFDLCLTCRRKKAIHIPSLALEVVP